MEKLVDTETGMRDDIESILNEAVEDIAPSDGRPKPDVSPKDLEAAGVPDFAKPGKKAAPPPADPQPTPAAPAGKDKGQPPKKDDPPSPFFTHGNYSFQTQEDLIKKLVNADTFVSNLTGQIKEWQSYGQEAQAYQKDLEDKLAQMQKEIDALRAGGGRERIPQGELSPDDEERMAEEYQKNPPRAIAALMAHLESKIRKDYDTRFETIKRESETARTQAERSARVQKIKANLEAIQSEHKMDRVTLTNFLSFMKDEKVDVDAVTSDPERLGKWVKRYEQHTLSSAGARSPEQQEAERIAALKLSQTPPGSSGPRGGKGEEELDDFDRAEMEYFKK